MELGGEAEYLPSRCEIPGVADHPRNPGLPKMPPRGFLAAAVNAEAGRHRLRSKSERNAIVKRRPLPFMAAVLTRLSAVRLGLRSWKC